MGGFLEKNESPSVTGLLFSPLKEASMNCNPGSSFSEAQRPGPHPGLKAGHFLPSVTLLFDLSSIHLHAPSSWDPGHCSLFGGFALLTARLVCQFESLVWQTIV